VGSNLNYSTKLWCWPIELVLAIELVMAIEPVMAIELGSTTEN
jgi:hypothetical protein